MFTQRVCRIIKHVRLQPIRVFCFHHVTDIYEESCMWEEDWTQTDRFKSFILRLKEEYVFISLSEAHDKMKSDFFRRKKYAVLTADDGYRSFLNIYPWLEEHRIPITLFVNPKYILEDSIGENTLERIEQTSGTVRSEDLYLKINDIRSLQSPLITFGYHGYEHLDEWKIGMLSFTNNLEKCIETMNKGFSNVIPYYAHTYGHAKPEYDKALRTHGLMPVYISGNKNYDNITIIDRELISDERVLRGLV